MTQDTRLVHLTAASKRLSSCQCARTHWNMSVLSLSATFLLPREWVRTQQAATFLLPQQKSCSRIKQCSPSGQLKSWATKVASVRLALQFCGHLLHRLETKLDEKYVKWWHNFKSASKQSTALAAPFVQGCW